jgi:assimilatory nitrate reductase catalytic subunit
MTLVALQPARESPATGPRFAVEGRDFPSNRGALCRKGFSAGELLAAPDRLTTPLLRRRKGENLEPCSWQEAIELIGARIEALASEHGADSVGTFGGGGLTNETAYALGKFTRVVLGSRNIDYNGRFCMASAATALTKAFGIDRGLPFPLSDLAETELLLLVGANPAETMPPLMQHIDLMKSRGGRLIVIDPRRTPTAQAATLHLQPVPGTDVALANGLLHLLVKNGAVDHAFIELRTAEFGEVRRVVQQYWPDRVERITGVPVAQLERAALWLAEAKTAIGLTARGVEQSTHGVDGVLAFVNLLLALGQVGKPSAGFGCLTGQGNGQGGREHGQKADQLPGYRKLTDTEHRAAVARVWGVSPESLPGPGVPATELIDGIGLPGGVSGLLVFGSNLVVSAPRAVHAEEQLRRLELLVVCDAFLSDTARLADVVLPVCHFAEHEGTLTNLEGRLLWRQKVVEPPPGVLTDLQVLELLAIRLGQGGHVTSDARRVFEELGRASAGGLADYAGFDYQRLAAGEELFWPCPSPEHPGTPRLFSDGFPTPSGRARFHPVEFQESSERVDERFPYFLTTGRLLVHYQTATQTSRVPSLLEAEPKSFVSLHPSLAATLGLRDGDLCRVRSRHGEVLLEVRTSTDLRLDTVFVPFHFGGKQRANVLTSGLVDPGSKIPEFKLTAVSLEPVFAQANLGSDGERLRRMDS